MFVEKLNGYHQCAFELLVLLRPPANVNGAMGLDEVFECCSSDAGAANSRQIDKKLRKQRREIMRTVSILLLGSGESGKSTFLKQMVIIHGRGEFTADEVREYRHLIYQNVVTAMRVLVDARGKLQLAWDDTRRQQTADQVFRFATSAEMRRHLDAQQFATIAPLVQDLWKDSAIQKTFNARHLFQIADSCRYFFDHLERLAEHDFIPTNRDILLCRKATKAITETRINVNNVPFRFIDVGGQRSQRQKWFQCFEGVTAIMFLVASSEFDQVVVEDRRTNRFTESRNVFETIVNNRNFTSVPIIVFMNKTDLLTEKVKAGHDIREHFADFQGAWQSVQDVQFFLLGQFEAARKNRNLPFFYHFTTAVDTQNIRRVFDDCKQIILQQNLNVLMMQ